MKKEIFKFLNEIKPVSTVHGTGLKQVFVSSNDTDTCLTQFAFCTLKPGESCKKHTHKTMEEYFYFLKGNGEYLIEDNTVYIQPKMFLKIPANKEHKFKNTGNICLDFVYFGVANE